MRRLIHQSLDSVQVIKWILWRRSIQPDLSLPLFHVIVLSLSLSLPFNGQPPTPMSAYTPRETTPRVHFVPPKLQGKPRTEYNSFVRRVYSSRKKFSILSLLLPIIFTPSTDAFSFSIFLPNEFDKDSIFRTIFSIISHVIFVTPFEFRIKRPVTIPSRNRRKQWVTIIGNDTRPIILTRFEEIGGGKFSGQRLEEGWLPRNRKRCRAGGVGSQGIRILRFP